MKRATGSDFLSLAALAFGGIGLEVVLAFGIEPLIYGAAMSEWSDLQNILHWIITCALWGGVSWGLIHTAKKSYGFDLFRRGNKVAVWQWILIAAFIIGSLIVSYVDWNGSKLIKEFSSNGLVKFIFQYLYYVFETALVMLILIFGQMAFEKWFHRENIPYGGIIVAITWGIGHFFTKDIWTGIASMLSGLAFGSVYLLLNRDVRKTFPVLLAMFVL